MGNRKVAGKRCRIAFLWATFLAFLAVPIFGDFTDVFATVEIIKGPGGSEESGGGNSVDCEARSKEKGYENFYFLEWTQDCAGASWIYYESTGDVNEAVDFSPYMSWHNKVIPYIKFNIPQGCSDTGFWHYGSNGYYNGTRAPWGWYYGFGNGAGWGHWQSYAYNVTGTSWIPYVLPPNLPNKYPNFNFGIFTNNVLNHVIKNNNGVVAYRAKKYGTPDEVLKDLQNEQILAGDEPETSLNGIAGFCSHGGMMILDAFTVDSAGNYINTSGSSTNEAGARISGMPKSVKKNEQGGTISAPTIIGYQFVGWRQNRTTGATSGSQSNYNVGIMDVGKTFYAVYEKISVFNGSTNAESGGRSTNMALTGTTKALNFSVNCPASGCEVEFKHRLKRISGNGNTDWKIYRLSNYWDGTYGAEITPDVIASGVFSNDNETVVRTQTYKLKSGVKICEQMDFRVDDSNRVRTTVCVLAVGSTSETLLDIRVKNDTIGGSYEETAYAKPGDTVTYKTTYDPSPQYTYNLIPGKLQIDGGTVFDNESGTQLFRLFDNNISSGLGWKNAFNITGFGGLDFNQNNIYSGGDASKKEPTNTRGITSADVGKSLIETAKTNVNDSVKTTPKKVAFSAANNGDIIANVITTEVESSATVVVPYNFTISTEIVDAGSSVVYAGENSSIRYKVEVNEKDNQLTKGKYATKVTGVKHRVEFCLDGVCRLSELKDIDDGDLNPGGGKVTKEYSLNIKMPDTNAGSEVCMRSLVTPSSSGSDDNTSPSGFNNDAASSDYACIKIAKKPSFQVWGGNLFVNGNVTVPVSEKGTLSGYGSGSYKFGSWSELGVFGNGQIKGISSGVSVGYSGANFLKNPGGLNKTNACLRSVLSFANNSCSSGTTGNMAASGLTTDKSKLSDYIDKIAPGMNTKIGGGNISLGSGYSTTDKGVVYWLSDSDLAIGASTLASGKTYVVRSKNNVTINGNLEYENKSYANLNEIPKLFIYAEKNIRIGCAVSRIDAVLITKGDIDTCSDSDNINNAANSNRLKINGAVIANTANLKRTYGGGVGNQSMVPAEIINYDTTLYMWLFGDTSMTGDGSNDAATFTEVRREELAPRY